MIKGQNKIQGNTMENLSKVWSYIWKRTNRERVIMNRQGIMIDRIADTRPVEIKTILIARSCGLTYTQVRRCLDILTLNGYIKKYVVKDHKKFKKMWIQKMFNHQYLFHQI